MVIYRTGARTIIGLLIFAAAHTASASPKIVGNAGNARCRDALHLADAAFRSTSGSLLWPIATPSRRSTKIVLRQKARDISGGGGIDADATAFTMLPQARNKDYKITSFWAARPSGDGRLIVIDEPFNWQGDWYYVFLVSADMTPDRFFRFFTEHENERPVQLPLLGDNRWSPPIVLEDQISHNYWLIDRGEPYEVMADWKVYVPAKEQLSSPCRITFGYSPRSIVSRRLPAVRALAALLDEALGPGTGEGTLQQTARIRVEVAHEWANASLRPWALSDEPYNSRAEVERGLADWANGSRARSALLRRIHTVYPEAERELAKFYEVRFKRNRASSNRLSRESLDHMFRSYFAFSKHSL